MPRILPAARAIVSLLAGWLAANLLRVVGWIVATGLVFLLIVGGICWLLLRNEPASAQWTAAVLTLLATAIVGLISGAALAAVATLGAWVREADLGGLLSKAVFSQTLGVSDKRPAGRGELAESIQGATVGEVKQRLTAEFKETLTGGSLVRWLPAQGRWLLAKLVSTAAWFATLGVIDQIPGSSAEHAEINLLKLRNDIGDAIEDRAVDFVGLRAKLLAAIVAAIAATVVLLTAAGLRAAL